jgi:hypothetical protein
VPPALLPTAHLPDHGQGSGCDFPAGSPAGRGEAVIAGRTDRRTAGTADPAAHRSSSPDHRPSPGAQILRLRTEPSAWRQPAGWPDPEKARGETIAAAFRVGPFSRQAQVVCRAYTWPASRGPPRVLPAARAAPVRADLERPARGAYRQCPDALAGTRPWGLPRQAAAAAPKAWQQLAPAGISRPARPMGAGATVRRGRDRFQGGQSGRSPARDCAGCAISSGVRGAGPDAWPVVIRHVDVLVVAPLVFAVPEPPRRPGRPA